MRPLEGVKVAELGHYIAGPHAAQILGELGATVVKVESLTGDRARVAGPRANGHALNFAVQNGNKASIAIDLRNESGRAVYHDLLGWADVLITNYAPASLAKIGADYEGARERNPALVYIQISGFGAVGPYSNWSAYDGVIQAMSGIVDMTGDPQEAPAVPGLFLADYLAGIYAALAALAALRARDSTGEGQYCDLSMLDSLVSIGSYQRAVSNATGTEVTRTGQLSSASPVGLYPTNDGYVFISANTDHMWAQLAVAMGRDDLAADENLRERPGRVAARAQLDSEIAAWTRTRSGEEIATLLQERRVPAGPVNSVCGAGEDPRVTVRADSTELTWSDGLRVPATSPVLTIEGTSGSGTEHAGERAVPDLGSSTRDVLRMLGYDGQMISELFSSGAVQQAGESSEGEPS